MSNDFLPPVLNSLEWCRDSSLFYFHFPYTLSSVSLLLFLQCIIVDDKQETAKRIVVDYVDSEEVVQKLRILPHHYLDFTVKQLWLMLQAFGRNKFSVMKKVELSIMLHEALTSEDGLSDPEKIGKYDKTFLMGKTPFYAHLDAIVPLIASCGICCWIEQLLPFIHS